MGHKRYDSAVRDAILYDWESGMTGKEIAKKYGCHESYASYLYRIRTDAHTKSRKDANHSYFQRLAKVFGIEEVDEYDIIVIPSGAKKEAIDP